MATFLSLYSGSSGNCALIGENGRWLCVDMGKNCKTTLAALYSVGLAAADLDGILVTHEHSDHVSGLKVFLKHYPVPVYGSAGTLEALEMYDLVPPGAQLCPLTTEAETVGAFEVRSFHTSHDSADCRGYRICTPAGHTAALATDLGTVTQEVRAGLGGADLAVLEANYDPVRLKTGPYPAYLKARIASPRGHLANGDTGAALTGLLGDGCERFALCHLSKENNTPELALTAVTRAFLDAGARLGRDGLVQVLSRSAVTPAIEF